MRLFAISKLVGAWLLLFAQEIIASPIHPHCDVQRWFEDPVVRVIPALPITNPINVIVIPNFVQEAPTSVVPNCVYELSDITSLEVTLRVGAPGSTADGEIEFLFVPPQLPFAGAGPWTFSDGSSLFFAFPPHATSAAGDIHVRFPNDPANLNTRIEIQLESGLSELGTTLRDVRMEFRGNHYFIIPEPSTYTLMSIGVLGLLGYGRSIRGRVDGLTSER